MNKNTKAKGITLIALVITIIVLLILAGISISMLAGNNGIITRAGEAKEETVVGQEKELVKLAFMSATVKKLESNITSRELQDELDISVGEGKTKVSGSRRLKVKFEDTKNEYTVSTKGVVLEYKEAELTDIYVALCRDKDEENDENGNGNILVFGNNKEDISNSYNIIEEYDNIKGKEYGYNKSDELFTYAPWHNISYPIELNYIFSVDFLNEIVPENF